jgi:nitroreductase
VTLDDLAGARRTHKAFGPEPVPQETLLELFRLAQLAPNHHLTQPWRFRVLGPETLERLKEAGGPSEALKLDRAPTLVVVSAVLSGEVVQDEEDVCATASAIMLVLLGATERGLASYWRTPGVLRTARGREAVGVPAGERVLGLIHLGAPAREPAPRERGAVHDIVSFLP